MKIQSQWFAKAELPQPPNQDVFGGLSLDGR
jgi:hypothetical protein